MNRPAFEGPDVLGRQKVHRPLILCGHPVLGESIPARAETCHADWESIKLSANPLPPSQPLCRNYLRIYIYIYTLCCPTLREVDIFVEKGLAQLKTRRMPVTVENKMTNVRC